MTESKSPAIMDTDRIKAYLSEVIGDPGAKEDDKIRAAHLLLRSLGALTDNKHIIHDETPQKIVIEHIFIEEPVTRPDEPEPDETGFTPIEVGGWSRLPSFDRHGRVITSEA